MRKLILLLLCLFWAGPASAKEIALSFDDAPRPGSVRHTGPERTQRLIAELQRAGVGQAVFFANSIRDNSEGEQRLRAYAAAGHLIANHSATHRSLNALGADAYLADVAEADAMLRPLPNFRPWFRYPYLREGDTVEKRDAVRAGLSAMGYINGYVTIDTYDWYLDKLARDAAERGDALNMDALRDLYIEAMLGSANFHDQLARTHLGDSPRHIILLHENDLAALFIADLVEALRRDGWTIISADAAYADPLPTPETMLLGQGRVAALAHDAGAPREAVFGPYEEEAELDALFAARVLRR